MGGAFSLGTHLLATRRHARLSQRNALITLHIDPSATGRAARDSAVLGRTHHFSFPAFSLFIDTVPDPQHDLCLILPSRLRECT